MKSGFQPSINAATSAAGVPASPKSPMTANTTGCGVGDTVTVAVGSAVGVGGIGVALDVAVGDAVAEGRGVAEGAGSTVIVAEGAASAISVTVGCASLHAIRNRLKRKTAKPARHGLCPLCNVLIFVVIGYPRRFGSKCMGFFPGQVV